MTKLAQWAGCSIAQKVILEEQKHEGPTEHCASHVTESFLGSARRLVTEAFQFSGGSRVLLFSPQLPG